MPLNRISLHQCQADNGIIQVGMKAPISDKEIFIKYHLALDAPLGLLATNKDHKEGLWEV